MVEFRQFAAILIAAKKAITVSAGISGSTSIKL